MRKSFIVLLAIVAMAGAACSKSGGSSAAGEPTDTGGPACSDLSGDNPFTITIHDFAFDPSCLTAASASAITVINEDSADHTFTMDDTQVDVTIAAGETFNGESAGLAPGDYHFHCKLHPTMTGMMTVV